MNCQTLFLYSEKKNNCKTTTGQKFRRGQKCRLTQAKTRRMVCLAVVYVYGNFAILIQSEPSSLTPYPIHIPKLKIMDSDIQSETTHSVVGYISLLHIW